MFPRSHSKGSRSAPGQRRPAALPQYLLAMTCCLTTLNTWIALGFLEVFLFFFFKGFQSNIAHINDHIV